MPSEAAAALADDFEAANAEVIAFALSCSPAQWGTEVPGEGWTVGVVVHHVAEGHAQAVRWLGSMQRGEPVPDTQDDIDHHNAEHAGRAAGAGVTETVALLRSNGADVATLLRGFDDGDLARTAPFGPAGGQEFAVSQLAPVTARHAREHVAHARAALGLE